MSDKFDPPQKRDAEKRDCSTEGRIGNLSAESQSSTGGVNEVAKSLTLHKLKQIRWLDVEIERLESQLKNLVNISGLDYSGVSVETSNTPNPTEKSALRAVEIRDLIESRLARRHREKIETLGLLEQVKDADTRLALTYYYVECMTLEQVAAAMSNDKRSISKSAIGRLIKRHIKSIEHR